MIGERARDPELMDRPRVAPESLHRTLDDLARVNRRLGGFRPLRSRLAGLISTRTGVRILDVGAGDAATLLHLRRWAPPSWRFVGIDLHAQILGIARERTRGVDRTTLVRGDALRMPFRDATFDVALCNLTLHHFGDRDAAALLREMGRVARSRVVVNDLHRHPLNYLGALLLARTVWRKSPVTRHDGPLSVRRAFTPDELTEIGRAAGLEEVRVRRRFPFRLVLEGRPPAGEGGGAGSGTTSRPAAAGPGAGDGSRCRA